jgi:hypothetical protein
MLFLRAIHSRYQGILNQFVSKQKDLLAALIDSVVANTKFMDEFSTVGVNGKAIRPTSTPCSLAAATAVTDRNGKEHCSPWEWLSTFKLSSILSCWRRSLKGGFYCSFCHSKDKHHPLKCPMLAELNLKLIEVGGGSSGGVGIGSKSPAIGPLASTSPGTPGAKVAIAVSHATSSSEASPSALAGMMAALVAEGDEDFTDSFCWDGDEDEDGVTFADAHNSMASVSFYAPSSSGPACCNVSIELALPSPTYLATQSSDNIVLPPTLIQALQKAIATTNGGTPFRLVVADTGATDHMVPDRRIFISYKSVHGLWVRVGNNLFASVLDRGMAIISLNGQRLLIRHVLHVPDLWVPLYSLRTHLCQSGCSFVGSYKTGLQVYFPGVVLTDDTSSDCHLTYKPLGTTAPHLWLHYVQP